VNNSQSNLKASFVSDECAMFKRIDADILINVVRPGNSGHILAAQSAEGAKALAAAMRAAGWDCTVRVWQTIASGNQPGYVEMPL